MFCSACFVSDVFFCVSPPPPPPPFIFGCVFVLSVVFRMFRSACFVPDVLFCVFCTGCFVPVQPSAPTITTCSPNGTVPANTAVSCTCTTSSVGQPQGRLKWVKVADGSQISVGGYGSTTLQMTPQTLTLSDHGVNKFRCDVDWVVNITGQSFRASVGCEWPGMWSGKPVWSFFIATEPNKYYDPVLLDSIHQRVWNPYLIA